MKILLLDIAWLAGILEGEGCFQTRKSGGYKGTPCISLQMTDKDTVEKVSKLWDAKLYGPYGPYGKSKLQTWQVNIFGKQAAEWMMTIYTLMGQRRQEKIKSILAIWKTQPVMKSGRMALCHPDKPRHAKDKCMVCYNKEYHANFAFGHRDSP
jgi:hypothetical protein